MIAHLSVIEDLASALLLEVEAIQVSVEKPFMLTSGKPSPVYFDCRRLISSASSMNLIASMFQLLVETHNICVDLVAGGESAGIPFADRLATLLGRPLVYVRKEARAHGTKSLIEGTVISGSHALLVEDLLTDGGTKLGFINGLRSAGAIVQDCFVVLDREQKGKEVLLVEGVSLYSLTTAERTLKYAHRSGMLSKTAVDSALCYLRDPDAWIARQGQ